MASDYRSDAEREMAQEARWERELEDREEVRGEVADRQFWRHEEQIRDPRYLTPG